MLARYGQSSSAFSHLGSGVYHLKHPLTSGERVAERLKGLRQGLDGFKTCQDHQGQKGQVDAINGLRDHEGDRQDEYGPQCQVHQDVVQRLLQPCNECHPSLYLSKCTVEVCDLPALIASTPTSQNVLYAL